MEIHISPLKSMKEVDGIVDVQRQAWNMDDIGIVPTFETRAVADAGFVYVAKVKDTVIGFIYGYHHFPDIHYSHMMAVLPKYQGQDVGYKLKKYHREQALKSKYHVRVVQWTVDPLLPNNAYLNFAKLGGYCDIYKVNYYGDPDTDGVEIYAGVPTDRFKLTWPIHTKRVTRRMDDYSQDRVSFDELINNSFIFNSIKDDVYRGSTELPEERSTFIVEVPANYQDIRRNVTEKAKDWRIKLRTICLKALERDYIIADYHSFKHDDKNHTRQNFYEFIPREDFIL